MAINLTRGDQVSLEKSGSKLTEFCVGCNWGAIVKKHFFGLIKSQVDVDIDLSCVLLDGEGNLCDHIYSPLYREEGLSQFGLPKGKLVTNDGALRHTGDDLKGDDGGIDDGLDNEIVTVDLTRLDPQVHQIFFFLNICGEEDFSQVPYAAIRMFEGTPQRVREVFASYNVAAMPQYAGRRAMILGKLSRQGDDWRFSAIGDPTEDVFVGQTVVRIAKEYNR